MQNLSAKANIPWAMAAIRAAMGPVIVLGERAHWSGSTLAFILLSALLSDIFDGVLARRWNTDTPALRLFDSMADTVFYISVALALFLGQPSLLLSHWIMLAALFSLEVLRFVFDIGKFGKPASYHSYLAKLWGLLLAAAVFSHFAFSYGGLLPAAVLLGILCNLEGLAMSLLLPTWCNDVKTLAVALRLRRQLLARPTPYPRTASDPEATPAHARRHGRVMVSSLALLAFGCCLPAFARDSMPATYVQGTSSAVPTGSSGALDTSSTTALIFRPVAAGTPLRIDYDRMQNVSYTAEVAHHLGVLPAIAVGLFARRLRLHRFAITFLDEAGASQTVLLEVPKEEAAFLVPLFRARAHACTAKPQQCSLFGQQ